jgi:hypothetical protein
LKLNDFILGRGLWKFNNSLLYEMDYVETVKDTIKKAKEQYAALVYDRSTLSEIDDLGIHFTINNQLFLETLLIEIRGKTISYASYRGKKKKRN